MLRLAVIALVVANLALLAYNLGWLDRAFGAGSAEPEPERLARQVHPGAITVLAPAAASAALAAAAASAAAAAAPACMQAGPFVGGDDIAAAEQAFAALALPTGAAEAVRGGRGGAYLIYMGRFADADAVQRKLKELERIAVAAEPLRGAPELQPGVSLGRYDTAEAAAQAHAKLAQHGVRTARVVTLRAATPTLTLRLAQADAALRERLAALQLPGGVAFARCPATDNDPAPR